MDNLRLKRIELRKEVLQNAYAQAATLVKGLLLFNGGGAALILTFLGNVLPSQVALSLFDLHQIFLSFLFFTVGCFTALTCSLLSFVTAAIHADPDFEWHQGYERTLFIRTFSLLLAILSLLCFLGGALNAVYSVAT